jgi:CRP-like cAMP-binding protein
MEMMKRLDHAGRRVHQAGSDLTAEGDIALTPMFIVSGWAARLRVLSRGRRQIVGLLLPGDGVSFHGAAEPVAAFTITALTTVETVDAAPFLEMAGDAQRNPGVAQAIQRAMAQEECFSANQILRLGSQNEIERLANFLMEIHWRLGQAGLTCGASFPLPLTAETLSDVLSMTPSRVRRKLRALRSSGLFAVRYGCARLISSTKAGKLAEFRPPESSTSSPSRQT